MDDNVIDASKSNIINVGTCSDSLRPRRRAPAQYNTISGDRRRQNHEFHDGNTKKMTLAWSPGNFEARCEIRRRLSKNLTSAWIRYVAAADSKFQNIDLMAELYCWFVFCIDCRCRMVRAALRHHQSESKMTRNRRFAGHADPRPRLSGSWARLIRISRSMQDTREP